MKKILLAYLLSICMVCSMTGCDSTKPDDPNVAEAPSQPVVTQEVPSQDLIPTSPDISTPAPAATEEPGTTYLDELEFSQEYLASLTYAGEPYVTINDNYPYFTEEEMESLDPFETFSELDSLGRCGVCYANICQELMPTEKRGEIGMVKPSGWKTARYDDLVDGKYLYNRCHLIGFQLSGENANTQNLITGTRYLNVQGMLPFENMVADYVHETDNHVLYRVTPIFDGDDLVAKGVLMEAYSVEDDGQGVQFNIFCYNVQPGVRVDYATGDSWVDDTIRENTHDDPTSNTVSGDRGEGTVYILNTRSKKVHLPSCSSAADISEQNRKEVTVYDVQSELIDAGYEPCKSCNPF